MKSVASISGFSHGDVTGVGGQVSMKFVTDSYHVTILMGVCILLGFANTLGDCSHAGVSTGDVMDCVMGAWYWVWVQAFAIPATRLLVSGLL